MTLYRQGNVWYYDFTVRGARHAGSTGETTKTKAQAVHDRLRLQFREGANIKQVWEQTKTAMVGRNTAIMIETEPLWKHFVAHAMSHASPRRKLLYKHYIEEFVEWCKKNYGSISVGEVTSAMATEYITEIRSRPGAPATKNERHLAVKMLFQSFDEGQGVIENPFEKIKRLPNRGVSREIFSQHELQLIGEKAEGYVLDICLTALYTGLRRGDICQLRWSAIDEDCRWIHLTMGKTGRAVDIPVMPRLREHLLSLPRGGEYVFPTLYDLYKNHPGALSHSVKHFLDEIGISGTRRDVEGYARRMSSKDIHSFRHTFVYLAACNNIPLPVVQSIVGHASPAMTKIYMDHASQADKQRFMAAMPDLLSGRQERPRIPIADIIAMVESGAPKDAIIAALEQWA